MDKILLFGGTGEGRALAEWMLSERIPCTVCVATEYGETLLPDGAEAHVGRMDRAEMAALMAQGYALVVDAISASRGQDRICQSPQVGEAMAVLKEFMFANVYTNPIAKGEESKAQDLSLIHI